jgi:hypothetical protein
MLTGKGRANAEAFSEQILADFLERQAKLGNFSR